FHKKTVMSLEIFPPKTTSPIDTVLNTLEELKNLKPDFISVTYGAAGSGRSNTTKIASLIKNKYNIEALAHLTCISSTEAEIDNILKELKDNNIQNILALRGDIPVDTDVKGEFTYANDLVQRIKEAGDFSVSAACYPEGHVEASNLIEDMKNLKLKVKSGADFLITQMFFDNGLFYNFREKLDLLGVNIPVSAGIMPVINKKQIEKITSFCGASLPAKFKRILLKYENNPEALKQAGIVYATEQIIDLLAEGVDGIHLYTMNRPEVAKKIFENFDSIRHSEDSQCCL
ncbi:MAG: methylenetetrahydrofolate reductase [NAD(P)H], partial [Clostridiaceae bacterium]